MMMMMVRLDIDYIVNNWSWLHLHNRFDHSFDHGLDNWLVNWFDNWLVNRLNNRLNHRLYDWLSNRLGIYRLSLRILGVLRILSRILRISGVSIRGSIWVTHGYLYMSVKK